MAAATSRPLPVTAAAAPSAGTAHPRPPRAQPHLPPLLLFPEEFPFELLLRHPHPTRLSLFQQRLLGTNPGHSPRGDPGAALPRLRLSLGLRRGLGCLGRFGCLGLLGSGLCLGCSRSRSRQLGLGLGFLLFLKFVLKQTKRSSISATSESRDPAPPVAAPLTFWACRRMVLRLMVLAYGFNLIMILRFFSGFFFRTLR